MRAIIVTLVCYFHRAWEYPPPVGGEVPMFRPEPARTLPFCPDALLGGMPHLRLAMIDLTGSNIPDEWLRENHQVVLRRHIWS